MPAQQHIDKSGYVGDVHIALTVNIGILWSGALSIASQQYINEGGHVGDVHTVITVNIARLGGTIIGQTIATAATIAVNLHVISALFNIVGVVGDRIRAIV